MKLQAIVALTGCMLCSLAWAEGEPAPEATAPEVQYVEISPALITNYLAPDVRFVRADFSLRVEDPATAAAVEQHKPFIRDRIIRLLNNQPYETLMSTQGRQVVLAAARDEIVNLLAAEHEAKGVQEVLMTSFLVE